MADTKKTSPFLKLPNELLAHILSYFGTPHPSGSLVALRDEPRFDLTCSKIVDLKAVSLVSKLWRQQALPLLFKHARFVAPKPIFDKTDMDSRTLHMQIQPFLDFVRIKSLKGMIASFALVIEYFFPHYKPYHEKDLYRYSHFWVSLFKGVDPEELIIVAPPAALDPLCSCFVYRRMAYDHDCPYQYLRLQNPSTRPTPYLAPSISIGYNDSEREEYSSFTTTLFQLRPWSTMLLNEGSSIRAYSIDDPDFEPPSILAEVLGEGEFGGCIPPTVRDLEYIAIFPPLLHFAQLVDRLPRLDRFYVQLVPRNDVLHDSMTMADVESNDLWEERNRCYAMLMQQLFTLPATENFDCLRVFESGDAADEDAWNLAVEYVKTAGIPWHIVRDGVFEKNQEEAPVAEDGEEPTFE